jgi:hypothetical protein
MGGILFRMLFVWEAYYGRHLTGCFLTWRHFVRGIFVGRLLTGCF